MILGWLGVALGVAVLDWLCVSRRWRLLGYFTKPGVMWVLAMGLLAHGVDGVWLLAVMASLVGDVLLMLPRERFLAGLVAFLGAHVAYVFAFLQEGPPPLTWGMVGLTLAVGVAGGRLYRALALGLARQGRHRLRVPVAVYALALGSMLVAAGSTLWRPTWPRVAAWAALSGGGLFFVSDALLAWNRFVAPLSRARLKVRILYHGAQILLVAAALLRWGG